MKLRSLAVNQFKKFVRPTRLDGIEDGLNVVVGPNEMGKSTLLDALRAVLFEKHSSRAQAISSLQNDRSMAAPVVELLFELDDGNYKVTKRFLKKPYAHLSCADGRILEGDAAEDALRGLLGFSEPGKSGAKPETLGMWSVLWVQQGRSFGTLDIPESARSSLHGALESEVGTVLGGRRGRALPQAVERQLGELVTGSNRPRRKYKEVTARIESLLPECAELRERRQGLSDTLDELEASQEKLSRLQRGDREQSDQGEIEEARNRHRRLSELEARIAGAKSDLELARRNHEQADRAVVQRRQLRDSIAEEAEALEVLSRKRSEDQQQEKTSREQLEGLRTVVRQSESALGAAENTVSEVRSILGVVQRSTRVQELEVRYEQAKTAEARLREVQQEASSILVTEHSIKKIRKAATALESVAARLSAAATVVTFDIEADRLSGIELDGKSMAADDCLLRAVEPISIWIPERGRITIEPAVKDRESLLEEQREARARLKSELDSVRARSPSDAEDQYDRHRQRLQEVALAQKAVELLAPASGECKAGAQSLADHVQALQHAANRERESIGLGILPDLRATEKRLEEAIEGAANAQHSVERARAALTGPEEIRGRLQTALGVIGARYDDANERFDRLLEQLRTDETALTGDELASRVETRHVALVRQEELLAALEDHREEETLEQLDARIQRLEQMLNDRRDERQKLLVTIRGLESHVEALEGVGLDESLQHRMRELEILEEQRARYEREVAVLSLLLATLRTAEGAAKEMYLAPVLSRLRPYLRLLFPGSDVTINEDLQVVGVLREAGYDESFEHLSMGTREQIAVLVRLAFAEMLAQRGYPATVILDDALVFSDDRRMKRMFDILNVASQHVQILILTCREQLFEEVGGHQLTLQLAGVEELRSA